MQLSSKLSCSEFFHEIGMEEGQPVWYQCPLEGGSRKYRLEEEAAQYLLFLKRVLRYRCTVQMFHTGPDNEKEEGGLDS